jgi:hypothetical protein
MEKLLETVEKETVLIEIALMELLAKKQAQIEELNALNKTSSKKYYKQKRFYESISIIENLLKDFKPQRHWVSIPKKYKLKEYPQSKKFIKI